MPFTIVRNDITHMQVDAVVNTANPQPIIGEGVDAAIHAAAGPQLLQARQAIGPIAPGSCAITPGFDLPARHVIHTVGPAWQDGSHGEEGLLRSCYARSLTLAAQHHCTSVAFPLISSGTYGFPKALALQTAVSAISAFLLEQEMQVYLVVFDRQAFDLSGQLFSDVASYIDEHYALLHRSRENAVARRRRAAMQEMQAMQDACCAPAPAPDIGPELDALWDPDGFTFETDAGFSETLLHLIDQSGEKDSAVYKRANISRQHFSKIRSDSNYRPTKSTVLAFAIALRLDLPQTRDLLERAGYALSRSSMTDAIVRCFIEHGHYNINDINLALFKYDQPQLGS